MDQGPLVENQIDEGRRIALKVASAGFDVAAAFWVRTSEDGQWALYIATNIVDNQGPAAPYRVVTDAWREIGNPWISLSEIKVIGVEDPITRDVLAIMNAAGHACYGNRSCTQFAARWIMLGS